jgi:hypothetical protein
MPFRNHASDDIGVSGTLIINATLPKIDTSNEECRLCVIFLEEVEKLGGVDVGAVIKC